MGVLLSILKGIFDIAPLIKEILKRWDKFQRNKEIKKLVQRDKKRNHLKEKLKNAKDDKERTDIIRLLNSRF